MKILYDLINYRANKTWQDAHNGVTITRENLEIWRDCWLNAAKILKARFEIEGLYETANEIQRIIKFEENNK